MWSRVHPWRNRVLHYFVGIRYQTQGLANCSVSVPGPWPISSQGLLNFAGYQLIGGYSVAAVFAISPLRLMLLRTHD